MTCDGDGVLACNVVVLRRSDGSGSENGSIGVKCVVFTLCTRSNYGTVVLELFT